MKKLLAFCLLIISFGTAEAQTAEETMEWINVKFNSYGVKVYYANASPGNSIGSGNQFTVASEYLMVEADRNKEVVKIYWKEIKDVNQLGDTAVGIFTGSDKSIRLRITKETEKFIKVLKHMAKLKGATLIADDLFGN